MPYPAARLNPDRTPCVMKVRGSRDGVSDAAKKSVPRRMPTAEKERHNRRVRYRITVSSVADGGGSRQLTVRIISLQSRTIGLCSVWHCFTFGCSRVD